MKTFDFRPTIKKAVMLSGLSITEIARRTNLSYMTIHNYLKGTRDTTTKNLIKIMKALKIKIKLSIK